MTSDTDKKEKKLLIKNIGLMLSGALEQPVLDADAILVVGGFIRSIGNLSLDTTAKPIGLD